MGVSWPTNGFDRVCEAPGEYMEIFGVLCKNGHVAALEMCVHPTLISLESFLSQLISLESFLSQLSHILTLAQELGMGP